MSIAETDRPRGAVSENATDGLLIRGLQPGERLDDILTLLQDTMSGGAQRWVNRRLWEWKHIENPFGCSLTLIAEARDGRIAGLRAFMRWRLRSEGRTLEAYRPVDTATHADFRRMGVFTRLTREACESARQAGGEIIFNTPNSMSVSGYLKMGWKQVGVATPSLRTGGYARATWRLVRGGARRIPGLKRKPEPPAVYVPVSMRPENALTRDFEPLIERQGESGSGLIGTDSSLPYLLWRYGRNPLYKYAVVVDSEAGEVTGACFVRLVRDGMLDTLVFEEFLLGDPSDQHMRRLADMAFDAFKPHIGLAYAPPGSAMSRRLAHAGFRWKSRSRINFVANPLSDEISPAAMAFSSWAIGMSELEIF